MVQELTIQMASDAVGISVHTLRYYERAGLLDGVERLPSGHRRYTENDLNRVHFLIKMRTTGMSIQQLKEYVDAVRKGDETIPLRLDMMKAHRQIVLDRIADLENCLSVIDMKISRYNESTGEFLACQEGEKR